MGSSDLTDSQFKELSRIVYDVSGINLVESKKNLLKARIAKRLRSTRIDSVTEYIALIKQDTVEFSNFIDGVTTNHTYFFRENKHCEFIVANLPRERHLKIWSAASSSGEEAYSIAIQLLDNAFSFEIFASDISETMLACARQGVYHMDRTRAVPDRTLRRYFLKGKNRSENMVRIKDEVKKYVTFDKYNLVTGTSSAQYDIIFCRNVMIYFDLKTKQKVVNDIYNSLKPGGYFIFGLSESVVGIETPFYSITPSIYQKKE